jgi:uncharacterized phage protein gp47/JayE
LPLITSPIAQITSTGITAPAFSDILAYLISGYQGIFGADLYLGPDTQEGQFLAMIASALNDGNSVAIAIYNAFSPATAQGTNLSTVVKINGITRAVSSYSECDILCTGVAGTILSNAVVADVNGIKWALPTTVTIPPGGQITATATCTVEGAISALPNTITSIQTPTRGWQTATNLSNSSPGEPVEDDPALRIRQATSVSLPSQTILDGIVAAVRAVPGVVRVQPYENDTATADANGIPSHFISLVVDGGDSASIAAAISEKKTPGGGTYGSTSVVVTDAYGSRTINFYRPTDVPIAVAISLTALNGYSTIIGAELQQAVANYINGLAIGEKVRQTRLFLPANLSGSVDGLTYEITSLQVAGGGVPLGSSDIPIAFNAAATCQVSDITLTVS